MTRVVRYSNLNHDTMSHNQDFVIPISTRVVVTGLVATEGFGNRNFRDLLTKRGDQKENEQEQTRDRKEAKKKNKTKFYRN